MTLMYYLQQTVQMTNQKLELQSYGSFFGNILGNYCFFSF